MHLLGPGSGSQSYIYIVPNVPCFQNFVEDLNSMSLKLEVVPDASFGTWLKISFVALSSSSYFFRDLVQDLIHTFWWFQDLIQDLDHGFW